MAREVFDAILTKIGLINPAQVALVLSAYRHQAELRRRLLFIRQLKAGDPDDEIVVNGPNFFALIGLLEKHVSAADIAIKSLGPPATWNSPVQDEAGIGFLSKDAAESMGFTIDPETGELQSRKLLQSSDDHSRCL